jgi:hypothetical protein
VRDAARGGRANRRWRPALRRRRRTRLRAPDRRRDRRRARLVDRGDGEPRGRDARRVRRRQGRLSPTRARPAAEGLNSSRRVRRV